MTREELKAAAVAMLDRAYVPYSHFAVGAALLGEDGQIYSGCNVENESYGSTLCAERVACVKMVSSGVRKFTALAVYSGQDYDSMALPCGACRQMLYEFAPGLTVLVAQRDHSFVKLPLSELLTHGFGPKSLG